ncbi:acetoin utilization deacetylase AcuC-like enzyme [Pelomonas saccharophila]|uniref:Acetoin utilization deacetylase AcuC-like enzyme n=1 Tax=Roseateles saccharophilus TaxID=304 RepID=A0ABU1YNB4_ROSSA|nr:histone deacetylase family protein [Roseateles saccharophilus]MDR7270348.1 acetoin utilization deacetylase AcuC-like enzyme [Roseateles saccharophilus]
MLPAYISHPDCLRHDMGEGHPECPQRLTAIADALLARGLLDYMLPYDAPLATEAQLERAHTALHVRRMFDAAPARGHVQVDPDTCMNPHTLPAALRAAGAAVLATDLVLGGQVPAAFCAVRPPGHHAEQDAAMGFCFFNNVAVGIRHALDVHGLTRVALVDFDVHHGNGSEDILAGDERVLMCSIFETGLYPFNGADGRSLKDAPNMVNVGLAPRSGSEAFRAAVTDHWLPALERLRPELIYISAGFDAHREDDMAHLSLVDADYAWVTRQLMDVAERHCRGRVISCLEGGYVLNPLARSVAAHVKVLIGAD